MKWSTPLTAFQLTVSSPTALSLNTLGITFAKM
jgi:hypothetical protein